MSQLVTEAQVLQFGANIYMLSQQKGSKLRPYVRQESIKGKARAFDRIGLVEAQDRVGRHSNTPQMDTPHSRRWCYLADKEWGDMIDDQDKIRMLQDPQSEYVMAAMWALGRKMDDVIIKAADAAVTTGEEADGTVAHPNSQKVACTTGSALSNLNVNSLRLIRQKFWDADIDEEIPLHIAVKGSQLVSMLSETLVTSSDYNTVKALVNGEIDTFMGFKFHRTNRITTQTAALAADQATGAVGSGGQDVNGFRKVVAWAQDGIILGVGEDMTAEVGKDPTKSFNTRMYAKMTCGGVRMEEEKVVIAFAKES